MTYNLRYIAKVPKKLFYARAIKLHIHFSDLSTIAITKLKNRKFTKNTSKANITKIKLLDYSTFGS